MPVAIIEPARGGVVGRVALTPLIARPFGGMPRRNLGGFARNDIRCRRSRERSGFLRRVYVSGYMVDGHVDGDFQRAT
jgi:hypothetical protein